MLGPRTLKIVGRADDLLNIRGIKIAPHKYEEKLAAKLPVKDVCITASADPDGNNYICVVLVAESSLDLAAMADRISPYFPRGLGRIDVVLLDGIPRTSTGKVRRGELNAMLAEHLKENGAPNCYLLR